LANLSVTESALAIVAPNDPTKQESVIHYGPQAQNNDPLKLDCDFHASDLERDLACLNLHSECWNSSLT
jgi:hypothetical protein